MMPARHDLVYLESAAWGAIVASRADLAEPVVAGWAEAGRPLVMRRAMANEVVANGMVPLGLPLPPSLGKRRIAVQAPFAAIAQVTPPPLLSVAMAIAPPAWQPALAAIDQLAEAHGFAARIFGGLAWQHVTGLEYLSATSDLDLLLPLPADGLETLLAGLAAIEAEAPMRLDGELVRADGVAVHWRELHQGVAEIMAKTPVAIVLMKREDFASEHFIGEALA
ncbi:MAG TPA: malonate decarboxylase holo-[acyl-carrier-protein] synthase [Stellaceae bacterium]|jgi:phosphoribosyl-dephospho-CoA transferase|nr:malonate decarboxylase holo-[acyl-carrier-protein] synthase [Stellaceae bacterium]